MQHTKYSLPAAGVNNRELTVSNINLPFLEIGKVNCCLLDVFSCHFILLFSICAWPQSTTTEKLLSLIIILLAIIVSSNNEDSLFELSQGFKLSLT